MSYFGSVESLEGTDTAFDPSPSLIGTAEMRLLAGKAHAVISGCLGFVGWQIERHLG